MVFNMRDLIFKLLCVVTFMVPLEDVLVIPGFSTWIFVISAVAMAMSLLVLISGKRLRSVSPVLLQLGVFVAWCCASLIWSVGPEATFFRVITYLSLLLFLWMISEFTDSKRQLLWVMRSYFLGCCVSLVMVLVAFVQHGEFALDDTRYSYSESSGNPNSLASQLDIAVIVAVYLAVNTKAKRRIVYWVSIPLLCFGVLLSGSRTGTIALVIAISMSLQVAWRRGWRIGISVLLMIGCAVWMIGTYVPGALVERVTDMNEGSTLPLRQELWLLGMECWRTSPVTGVGAGAFVDAVVAKGSRSLVAHNTFVSILVETGIVGMGLMLAVWLLLAQKVWQLPRMERQFWLAIGCVSIVTWITGCREYAKITWLIYALIIAQWSIHRRRRWGGESVDAVQSEWKTTRRVRLSS
jgi:O-antigen ligase